jgi:hypothetical protein
MDADGCAEDVNNHSFYIRTEGYYTSTHENVDNSVIPHDTSKNIMVHSAANNGTAEKAAGSQIGYYSMFLRVPTS